MAREPYPTDLTDEEWEQIEYLLISHARFGRKRKVDEREILNAIFYVLWTGCAWRMLPPHLPAWSTVYYYYSRWDSDGTLNLVRSILGR